MLEGEDLEVVAVERKKNGGKNYQDGYHGNELHKLKIFTSSHTKPFKLIKDC